MAQCYGNQPEVPAPEYRAHLLAEEVDPPNDYNRTHFAGFTWQKESGRDAPKIITNPGTFAFRGNDLGEIAINLSMGGQFPECNIRVRDHGALKPGEREFLRSQVVIPLADFVLARGEELAKLATEKLRQTLKERIRDAHAKLVSAEQQVPGMLTLFHGSFTKLPLANPHHITRP